MGVDLEQLLSVTVFRALDIDTGGRILAGSDESGSMQLTEIGPDGSAVALTALPGACRGRYLPGTRTVVRVSLAKRVRAKVRRAKHTTLKIRVTTIDASGNVSQAATRVRLRR